MKKSNRLFLMAGAAIIFQAVFLCASNIVKNRYPFLCGVFYSNMLSSALGWFIPVYFILSCFCERLSSMLSGYGQVMIIRNYNLFKLVAKETAKMHLELLLLILFQFIISHFFILSGEAVDTVTALKMLAIYYFSFSSLVMLQFFLEFFLRPQIANLIVSIYFLISPFAGTDIFSEKYKFLQYLFIPEYSMGYRNGLIINAPYSKEMISYFPALIILILLDAAAIILSVLKLKRTDIL